MGQLSKKVGLALTGSDDSGTLSDSAGAAIKSAVTDAHLLLVTGCDGLGTQFGNLTDGQGFGRGRHGASLRCVARPVV
jgi:hypothetical protein